MSYLSGKHLPRRTFLGGMGATVALPFLDAMVPAARRGAAAAQSTDAPRVIAMEMVHGAAGCGNKPGEEKHLWNPRGIGHHFDLTGTSLETLEAWRDHVTIVSNTDVRMAEAWDPDEIGGDHFRSSAVFLTQCHPRQTEGSDVYVGKSLDQIYAERFGQETPIPSMQFCVENVDQSGGCSYGYSCAYTDSISWASPTQPLPMIRDPRVAFEQLFGAGATPAQREARLRTQATILDWVTGDLSRLLRELGASDRRRMDEYLENVRELERRLQTIEVRNNSGEERQLPGAPAGVPDSFDEHVKLMFDLQVLAFQMDMTRVFSFKLGRDASGRVYPESGSDRPFHPTSHHGENEESMRHFAMINRYHVGLVPYLMQKLKDTTEGDRNLLEKTAIIYGSPMADGNNHSHRRCPLFLAGHAGGALEGGVHLKAPDDTPMANVFLTLLRGIGLEELDHLGDSTGEFRLNA